MPMLATTSRLLAIRADAAFDGKRMLGPTPPGRPLQTRRRCSMLALTRACWSPPARPSLCAVVIAGQSGFSGRGVLRAAY